MIHKEISDAQWSTTISPQLPKPAKTGRPRCDDGTTINGVLFVLTAGCRRADMPISTAQNPLHICGFGNCDKKASGERFCQD